MSSVRWSAGARRSRGATWASADAARTTPADSPRAFSGRPSGPDDATRRARPPPSPPAPVDQAVDRVHVEAPHLRRRRSPRTHAGAVLLPVDDVGEGVLHRHGSRVGGRGTRRFQFVAREATHERSRIANSRRVRAMTSFFPCPQSHSPPGPSWQAVTGLPERRSSVVTTSRTIGSLAPVTPVELADEVLDRPRP